MGVWRGIFGWDALFRWDALAVVVPGLLIAAGFWTSSTGWLPHYLLISQVCFGLAAFLFLIKIVGHAYQSDDSVPAKIIFCIVMGIIVLSIIIPTEFAIQKHKRLPPAAHLLPVTIAWNQPDPISTDTPLSSRELNATASAEGTLVYDPTFGATMNAGTDTLSVTFFPEKPDRYRQATKTVALVVKPAHIQPRIPGVLKASDITMRACSTTLVESTTVRAQQRFVGPVECPVMIYNNSKIALKDATLKIHLTSKVKITTIPPSTLVPSDSGSIATIGETYQIPIPQTLVKGGVDFPLSIHIPRFRQRFDMQMEIIESGIRLGNWGIELIPLHESD